VSELSFFAAIPFFRRESAFLGAHAATIDRHRQRDVLAGSLALAPKGELTKSESGGERAADV